MKSHVGHLQFNIDAKNLGFYKDLLGFLGWNEIFGDESFAGFGNDGETSLWFVGAANGHVNDHDGAGMNHFGIAVDSKADVDASVEFLRGKKIELLYETPCNRPEYTSGPEELYYSAMFNTPDNILFEIVYTGPV